MFRTYFVTTLRGFFRHKEHFVINLAGLVVGMTSCAFIFLYVLNEVSYDRHHERAESMFRVTYEARNAESSEHYAFAVPALAPALSRTFPEIEAAVRLSNPEVIAHRNDESYREGHLFFADSTFFDLFTFGHVAGNLNTALDRPFSVVLTRSAAEKYFGTVDVVGRVLDISFTDRRAFEITGVVEDAPPTSHFHPQIIASYRTMSTLMPWFGDDNWGLRGSYTYVRIREGADVEALQRELQPFIQARTRDVRGRFGSSYALSLQPLTDIHLRSHLASEIEANGNALHVAVLLSIAALILLIACANFMNLSIVRAVDRAKEVGVRKVVGARRPQLVRQFLTESLLLSTLATILTAAATLVLLPEFNTLVDTEFSVASVVPNVRFHTALLGLGLIVGLIGGMLPALFATHIQPWEVLRGTFRSSRTGLTLRKTLVVGQFVISTSLILGTWGVHSQLRYMNEKSLGFDEEQVVVLPNHRSIQDASGLGTVRQELMHHPGVRQVSLSSHVPGRGVTSNLYARPANAAYDPIPVTTYSIDHQFIPTLGIELKEGRAFSPELSTDSSAFVINEAAAERFGWIEPVGRRLAQPDGEGERVGPVIGVVENFHFESLRSRVEPVVLQLTDYRRDFAVIKLTGRDVQGTLRFLEGRWSALAPGQPFEYFFLDESYDAFYRSERRLGDLTTLFAFLANLTACVGLFGLAGFLTRQRTTEIGIRKVLGASEGSIVVLLSREFTRLVVVGAVIAIPLTYLVLDVWLDRFAYRIEIGLLPAGLTLLLVLTCALATVSAHAARAALMNPVSAIRS